MTDLTPSSNYGKSVVEIFFTDPIRQKRVAIGLVIIVATYALIKNKPTKYTLIVIEALITSWFSIMSHPM